MLTEQEALWTRANLEDCTALQKVMASSDIS